MTPSIFKGAAFTRSAIALAATVGETPHAAAAYAAERWGPSSEVATALARKSAVSGAGTQSGAWGAELVGADNAATEFVELVRPMTIIGKLKGLRRVPALAPVVVQSGGAVAYWVGPGAPRPLSPMAFNREVLQPRTVAAISVFSNELLRDATIPAETSIRDDLVAACASAIDATFIDPANTGSDTMPVSITHGATSVASSGNDLAIDIDAALAAFEGSLTTAAWICHPRLAVAIALHASSTTSGGPGGLACDVGALGGTLVGLPLITSEAVPFSLDDGADLVLVDARNIAIADEGAATAMSRVGTIEMSSAPTGNTVTPTAMTSMVSLFQTESAALLVNRQVNWKVGSAGAVVVVTGCQYGGVAS